MNVLICLLELSNDVKYYISEYNYIKNLGKNVCKNNFISFDYCYILNRD